MATGVEINCRRVQAIVFSGISESKRTKKLLVAGETETFPIHKDHPVVVQLPKDGRATAKSTTGINLYLEHEDGEDNSVEKYKLDPPYKQAMIHGKWVIKAPNAA